MAAADDIAVGIDLGTSYSCVAVAERGVARVLADAAGDRVHASVVTFMPDASLVVGNAARRLIATHPDRTVASAKRLMGRFFFSDEVKKTQRRHSFAIVEGPNSSVRIQIGDKQLTPQDIAAYVLKRMKVIAEQSLGHPVTKAVITCPAYFNDNQRQATRDAGELAGLEVLRILNEPTAAALSYGYGREVTQKVAVYDLGGGTFDVSILEIGKDTYEVLSTAGDTYLGGDDIDERIIDFVANGFFQSEGVDLREQPLARAKLLDAAELAKRALSKAEAHVIHIPSIYGGQDLDVNLTRLELARMSMDLLQRTFKVCDEALQAARLVPADLAGVILVGGPTRLPFIRNSVAHYFGQNPKDDVDPDEVVALGAALQASSLVHAGPAPMLLDVTPLTLRLATVGGYTEEIIPKNTPIPIERGRTFTTARDDQERVQVIVVQGEDRLQKNCEMLAHFEFSGLRKAPRGQVRIEVTFEIDASGIVNVSAKDVESGRAATTQITLSSGLSRAELDDGKKRAAVAEIVAVPK